MSLADFAAAVSGSDKAHSAKIAMRSRSTNHFRSAGLGGGVAGHVTPENGVSVDSITTSALAMNESHASNPKVGSSRKSAVTTASRRALMMGVIDAGRSGKASIVSKTARFQVGHRLAASGDRGSGPCQDDEVFHTQPLGNKRLEPNATVFLVKPR